MSPSLWLGSGLALALVCAASVAFADDVPLATYRAVHDLALDKASTGAAGGIVSGRLVTEFSGSKCTTYTTKTRFVTDGVATSGDNVVDDQRTTTEETPDGRFKFTNETYTNDALTQRSVGVAQRGGGAITVDLSEPEKRTFRLDEAIAFPTEQTERVIVAARAGKHFLSFDVYDGSDDGVTVLSTAAVVGAPLTADEGSADAAKMAAAGYIGVPHWPVTVSYFETTTGSDEQPFFVLSAVLYENGILTDLKMDYGKFSLSGKLTLLEPLPAALCPD